jgi:hypothetical protein
MASEVYTLFLLLSLKDLASGGLNSVEARLRATGKEAKNTLRDFQSLREGMSRGLQLAGVGFGGLMALKKGVDVAADFQTAATDLKVTISQLGKDGAVDVAKLNNEMGQLEALGIRLGNQLPGNTADYFQLFTNLKRGGADTKDIINGLGESTAKLAVSTHANPAEIGKQFAQLSVQFKLQSSEYREAANLFAKLHGAIGIEPEELIQGAKFAQLRGGLPMGMKGITGLRSMAMLLSTLKMSGLEAGIGGREMAALIFSLVPISKAQKKADDALRAKGINLQFMGSKGEFLGEKNLIEQMEKLRVLSAEERLTLLTKRFGSHEAVGPAVALMEAGQAGFAKLNQRYEAAIDLETKAAAITQTFNNRLENLKGTAENLVAAGFTPMLAKLEPILQVSNEVVGSFQEWLSAHPGFAAILGDVAGISMATIALTGVIRTGVNVWGLYAIATRAAGAALQAETVAAGEATVATGATASKLSALSKMSGLRIGITIAAVLVGFELIQWLKEQQDKYVKEHEEAVAKEAAARGSLTSTGQLFAGRGWAARNREGLETEALTAWDVFRKTPVPTGRAFDDWLNKHVLSPKAPPMEIFRNTNPSWKEGRMNDLTPPAFRASIIEQLRKAGGGALYDPNVLAKLIHAGQRGDLPDVKTPVQLEGFMNILKEAFGSEKFGMASEIMAEDMAAVSEQSKQASTNLTTMNDWFGAKLPSSLDRTRLAIDQFSLRLMLFQPASFSSSFSDNGGTDRGGQKSGSNTGPFDKPFTFGKPPVRVPSKASGGDVIQSGFVNVHRGEEIVPARVSDRWREISRQPFPLQPVLSRRPSSPSRAPAQPSEDWREMRFQRAPQVMFPRLISQARETTVRHVLNAETRIRARSEASVSDNRSVTVSVNYAPVLHVGPGTNPREFETALRKHSRVLTDMITEQVRLQRERR